jgi:hypothetical protein
VVLIPLVGVLTVPDTITSLVGDNTNQRETGSYHLRQGLFYPGLFSIGKGSPATGSFAI